MQSAPFGDLRLKANGLEFAGFEAGPADGPLALCLHGFPDTALTWRHLVPELASAGFHAVAVNLRGYAPTDVPADGCYHGGALVADAVALHEAAGGDERAVLIGHDWGAVAAYGAASFAPGRWRRIVTMAFPPPVVFMSRFFTYDQLRQSWYMFLCQSPLADAAIGADGFRFVDRLWRDWSPGYEPSSDLPAVRDALGSADNLAAALGYYRAMFAAVGPSDPFAAEQAALGMATPQPTLYLHGAADGCVLPSSVAGADAVLPSGSSVHLLDGVGHFLHLERPAEVNRLVLEFLTA